MMPVPARVLCLSGRSKSGKTSLLEALVPQLLAEGLRVAYAKPHAHGAARRDPSDPPRDSERMARAGAHPSMTMVQRLHLHGIGTPSLARRLLDEASALAAIDVVRAEAAGDRAGGPVPSTPNGLGRVQELDWILIEGAKWTDLDKIHVERQARPPDFDVAAMRRVLRTVQVSDDTQLAETAATLLRDMLKGALVPPRRARLLGAVLGGGRSRRMGRDKASLPVHPGWPDSPTWLARGIVLLRLFGADVVVAGRPGATDASRTFASTGATDTPRTLGAAVLPDLRPGEGPLAGLESALVHAASRGLDAVLLLPCDLPYLRCSTLARLVDAFERMSRSGENLAGVAFERDGAADPAVVIVSTRALDAVRALLDRGVRRLDAVFTTGRFGQIESTDDLRGCNDGQDWMAYARLFEAEDVRPIAR